jgi:hypothetical protein
VETAALLLVDNVEAASSASFGAVENPLENVSNLVDFKP